MLDLADALKPEPPRRIDATAGGSKAAKKPLTLRALRRLMLWGTTAAGALLLAALSSRSEVGVRRVTSILHGATATQVATRSFDAEAETRRLAEQLRGLAAGDEQIKSRLAAVERDMDDMTGSIGKQLEAADAARRSEDGPSLAATAAVTVSIGPPTAAAAPAAARSAAAISAGETATAAPRTEYGIDIGSGLTIDALRTRWLAIRGAHGELLEGLQPIVNIRDVPRTSRIELRLIAGPLPQLAAAAQLCASLTALGLFCQPTVFDGQHLALR